MDRERETLEGGMRENKKRERYREGRSLRDRETEQIEISVMEREIERECVRERENTEVDIEREINRERERGKPERP